MESKSKLTFSKVVERFSYGCGDFGCNIIYTAMSAFLLFYYTDYAKVSALAVGTIMMVSRIFDGISDIIMGVIIMILGRGSLSVLFVCFGFKILAKQNNKVEITPEIDAAINRRIVGYIVFYWLCNLFYMSCFINNLICKYIFGGLIMLNIFMNLATITCLLHAPLLH